MASLLRLVGEYFLGTEHYLHYTRRKAFRSEFIVNPDELSEDKRAQRNDLVMLLGSFKAGPALMTLGSLAVLSGTGLPLYAALVIAEAWRAGGTWFLYDTRETDAMADDMLKHSTLAHARFHPDAELYPASALEDEIDDQEGWKHGDPDEWRPDTDEDFTHL